MTDAPRGKPEPPRPSPVLSLRVLARRRGPHTVRPARRVPTDRDSRAQPPTGVCARRLSYGAALGVKAIKRRSTMPQHAPARSRAESQPCHAVPPAVPSIREEAAALRAAQAAGPQSVACPTPEELDAFFARRRVRPAAPARRRPRYSRGGAAARPRAGRGATRRRAAVGASLLRARPSARGRERLGVAH